MRAGSFRLRETKGHQSISSRMDLIATGRVDPKLPSTAAPTDARIGRVAYTVSVSAVALFGSEIFLERDANRCPLHLQEAKVCLLRPLRRPTVRLMSATTAGCYSRAESGQHKIYLMPARRLKSQPESNTVAVPSACSARVRKRQYFFQCMPLIESVYLHEERAQKLDKRVPKRPRPAKSS
jgi:hypothetical protein